MAPSEVMDMVAKGAKYLDRSSPEWWVKIDQLMDRAYLMFLMDDRLYWAWLGWCLDGCPNPSC